MKCHVHDVKKDAQLFLSRLVENGLRITKQRQILVKGILEFHSPFSADELVEKVSKQGVDRATVYRSLSSFADMGLLSTVDFRDQVIRFEPNLKSHHHHHHVVCTQCHRVEPLKICVVDEQEKRIEKMGYTNITHRLEFFGTCKACAS